MAAVEKAKAKAKKPDDYKSTANFKVLAALYELMLVTVPADPTRPAYRQGDTLGGGYKHSFSREVRWPEVSTLLSVDSKAKVVVYA